MAENPFMDRVRLPDPERTELLNRLDRGGSANGPKPRRSHARVEYRAKDICITITHPGGTVGRFLVCSRNLSAGGMSFVHGGFLHMGTECSVELFTATGQQTSLVGCVRSCRLLTRNLHEVGIEFNQKIDANAFCGVSARKTSDDPAVSFAMPDLTGNALVIGSDPLERRVLATRLKASGMNAVAVADLGPGLDQLKLLSYCIVLTEMQLPKSGPAETVTALRSAGFAGPIVGLAPSEAPEHVTAARTAKMQGCVGKPFSAATLLTLVAQVMKEAGNDLNNNKPVYSTIARNPGAMQLISHYISQARQNAAAIQKAVAEQDATTVSRLLQSIKGTAGGYGFAPLAEAARQTLGALEPTGQLQDAKLQIETLLGVCSRLQPGSPGDKPEQK